VVSGKKGVELSMNLIIIAAIAVIVLVILVILVTKGGINVTTGTGCTSSGGSCYELGDGETCADIGEGYQSLGTKDCKGGQYCCAKPFVGTGDDS